MTPHLLVEHDCEVDQTSLATIEVFDGPSPALFAPNDRVDVGYATGTAQGKCRVCWLAEYEYLRIVEAGRERSGKWRLVVQVSRTIRDDIERLKRQDAHFFVLLWRRDEVWRAATNQGSSEWLTLAELAPS